MKKNIERFKRVDLLNLVNENAILLSGGEKQGYLLLEPL